MRFRGVLGPEAPFWCSPELSGRRIPRRPSIGSWQGERRTHGAADPPSWTTWPSCARLGVDLTGRIPTEEEIQKFLALPAGERRRRAIDELLQRPQFADRWTIFFSDMIRIRSDAEGGRTARGWCIPPSIRACPTTS